MKIQLESTQQIVKVNDIDCRVWTGATESGIPIQALITRVAVRSSSDCSEFEAELREHNSPKPDPQAFPLKLVI